MSQSNNLHVVFGCGPLGQATARALLAQGLRVRMVSRGGTQSIPPGAAIVKADARDAAQAVEASAGAASIYQCVGMVYDINVWRRDWPRLQAAGIAAAQAHNAPYIFGDNLYMYGDTNGKPVDEASPYLAKTNKGQVRATLARELMEAHTRGTVRAACVRGSDFYGPCVQAGGVLGSRSIGAMLAGKPAQFIGNIDMPHTYTFIDDFGRAMATVGTRADALGQIWHAPNVETLSTRQHMTRFFEAAGVKPRFQVVPKVVIGAMGVFIPMMRELKEMMYGWEKPYIVHSDKIKQRLGLDAIPLAEAIATTLAWYRANGSVAAA